MTHADTKTKLYTRYPASHIALYNGVTVLHFLLGGAGIMLGYGPSWLAYLFSALYLAFAFVEMYLVMPLKVCPNCVYYGMKDAICISGLNVVSAKIARKGDVKNFSSRARGLLCHNNMYIASLVLPIIAIIPALIINFSLVMPAIFIALSGLLIIRFFVFFTKMVCPHCRAKNICPNAQSMGLSSQ
ncbi:hypothetical protein ES703_20058 [subsurface metagenome]|nr:hypothetical protein [Dehalococcoidia bacterium]